MNNNYHTQTRRSNDLLNEVAIKNQLLPQDNRNIPDQNIANQQNPSVSGRDEAIYTQPVNNVNIAPHQIDDEINLSDMNDPVTPTKGTAKVVTKKPSVRYDNYRLIYGLIPSALFIVACLLLHPTTANIVNNYLPNNTTIKGVATRALIIVSVYVACRVSIKYVPV